MKILKVEIYSPKIEPLRKVSFKSEGLSVIYGEVEKPKSSVDTTNSIGKTVLLKILNVILGANNSGKETIKGLKDYRVKSEIEYEGTEYNVNLIIGSSKDYYVNDDKMNLTKYRNFFNLNRSIISKQVMLEKRKSLLSTISKNSNKDDISAILNLLYLDNIQELFKVIKQKQDEIAIIGKYKKTTKEDTSNLQKEEFNLQMRKKVIDDELQDINNRLNKLNLSDNIEKIVQKRAVIDKNLKEKVNEIKLNQLRIEKYNEVLDDSTGEEISLDEVEKYYDMVNAEIPDMVKRKLQEVEDFYKYLIQDKNEIYKSQIISLTNNNELLERDVKKLKIELDSLSEIISENDSFKEAIKIYDEKTKEKNEIEIRISEINGKLNQINNTQTLKGNIDILYSDLYKEFEEAQLRIERYKEFVYRMVNTIYGQENRNPYLNISIADGSRKYQTMPIKIDLSIDGDSGEGITAVKYLLFDLMIMNFNDQLDFLIEDSACFEGIDRRQIKNILIESEKISKDNNKQLIVTLNKYLVSDYEDIKDSIVLTLSENDTLLNIKF